MKDSTSMFVIVVCYLAMILFFGIPVVKTILGHPFNAVAIITSIVFGFAFGFYATYLWQKYEEEGEKKHD